LSGIFEEVERTVTGVRACPLLMMWHGGLRVRMTGRSRNG
jgi:hypothetical protein